MERAGIASNEQSRTASERDQFRDGAGNRLCRAVARRKRGLRKAFLAGAAVDEGRQSVRGQRAGDSAVALGWPLFRAPSAAGVDDGEFLFSAKVRHLLGNVRLRLIVVRQFDRRYGESFPCDCLGERMILLDDVGLRCRDTASVQRTRRGLERTVQTDDGASARAQTND